MATWFALWLWDWVLRPFPALWTISLLLWAVKLNFLPGRSGAIYCAMLGWA
ncbi:hypothetical protein SAMN06273570_0047 [Candidatus Pantoea floridensis]|uniref:Uncharacterized protein n=1 Tax=Candidatus Pantoea floridensis TaxID=1938870 RepID=A0A286BLG2_9GAMM|nr:hypothetical protein BX596_1724 [Enterobacteriaceae bacterium JKS000233]SOD34998.1 hypothetical protein SAMN06273570_0047 [Pantoea floridensis]